jgi:hypothetical protein
MTPRSQAEPSLRNFAHRAGVRRTEPGTVFCSFGSARLPLRRGNMAWPLEVLAFLSSVAITCREWCAAIGRSSPRFPGANNRLGYPSMLWQGSRAVIGERGNGLSRQLIAIAEKRRGNLCSFRVQPCAGTRSWNTQRRARFLTWPPCRLQFPAAMPIQADAAPRRAPTRTGRHRA